MEFMKPNKIASGAVSPDAHKVVAIRVLFVMAAAIALSGAVFTAYSIVAQVTFRVFNAPLPGALLGLVVVYFGVRSFLSVRKLREEVYKKSAKFSWNNFKKQRSAK